MNAEETAEPVKKAKSKKHGEKKKKKKKKSKRDLKVTDPEEGLVHNDDIDDDDDDSVNADEPKQKELNEPVVDEEKVTGKVEKEPDVNGGKRNEIFNLNSHYGNRKGFLQTMSLVLNAALMVYAQVGLSAVIYSSQRPVGQDQESSIPPSTNGTTGACDAQDLLIWEQGGRDNRTLDFDFCIREYNGSGCLLDAQCVSKCFATTFGYSQKCSPCFGTLPQCGFDSGCALTCVADSFSQACQDCNIPCVEQLETCLGFLPANDTNVTVESRALQEEDGCPNIDYDGLNWYVVYELTFINSVHKAWNSDAKFLAFIIVFFSGIWPYVKKLLLLWVWYKPQLEKSRTSVLTWLLRLSKYTLVDVFAVIAVLVGTLLELGVGGQEVATRAEPRPSIIAFLLCTVWEFIQIEWVVHCHNKLVHYDGDATNSKKEHSSAAKEEDPTEKDDSGHLLDAMRFRTKLSSDENALAPANTMGIRLWVAFLLVSSIVLYLAGAVTEIIQFTSFGAGDTVGCTRSFNLVTFGNTMVSDRAMTSNSRAAGSWTLYIAYVILVLFLPITVHCMQIVLLTLSSIGDINKETNRRICKWTSILWGFSCVEVFLIALLTLEAKFEQFVAILAGEENAQFFTVSSSLGPAVYVFLAYFVVSGLLQYFIYCATAEYYHIDPYHKVHILWTKLLGCWLKKA